jgi:hypothetical protein
MSQAEIKKLTASLSTLTMEEKWKGTCTVYGSSYKFTFYTDKKKIHLFGEFLNNQSFVFSIKNKAVTIALEKVDPNMTKQELIDKIISYPSSLSPFGIGYVGQVSHFKV